MGTRAAVPADAVRLGSRATTSIVRSVRRSAALNHPLLGGHRPPGSLVPSLNRSSVLRHTETRSSHDVQPAQPQLPQGDRLRAAGAAVPAAALRGGEDRQVRRHRDEAARGQGDRPDLREDLDAHEVGVRGRRLRPGCPRHVPRPVRFAARPQGVGGRHGACAGSDVRRHRVPRQRTGRRRGAGGERRRAGLQRPHQRVAPDPDAGRLPDDARGERQTVRRPVVRLRRRLPVQHGPVAVGDGSADGCRRAPRRPGHAAAARRRGGHRP